MSLAIIRPILKIDNPAIAKVIRNVLLDLGVPKVGTAYADTSLDSMYENYVMDGTTYFVVELAGKIIGGAGIAQLQNFEGAVCELQKMYFLPEARGLGLGSKMMKRCLETAKEYGYHSCYIETMPYMETAQELYKRVGFEYIDGPMGDTGHYACPVHMLKKL